MGISAQEQSNCTAGRPYVLGPPALLSTDSTAAATAFCCCCLATRPCVLLDLAGLVLRSVVIKEAHVPSAQLAWSGSQQAGLRAAARPTKQELMPNQHLAILHFLLFRPAVPLVSCRGRRSAAPP